MEAAGVESHEVVVVGGGAAGLAAASALAREGVDVLVLEARPRWGGRIQTVRGGPEPIELGAEFVHGDAPHTTALAGEAGIELATVEMIQRWRQGDALVEIPDCERAQADAMQAALDAVRGKEDRPFAEALATSHAADPGRRLVLQYVEGFQAAEATRISTRALAQGDVGSEQTRRVPGGYDLVVEALVERVPAAARRVEHEVRSLRWSRGLVELVAHAGPAVEDQAPSLRHYRARRVIVALPLALLRDIKIDPPLDLGEKGRALALLTTGHAVRVVMRFRERLWRDRLPTPSFVHCPGSAFPVLWTGERRDSRTIVAWAGGPAAIALGRLPERLRIERALEDFAAAVAVERSSLEEALVEAQTHDWDRDRLSRGAYSYPLVGGTDAGSALAAPLDETLYFAGEAVSPPPVNGTVEGALASGFRAAREVLGHAARDHGPRG